MMKNSFRGALLSGLVFPGLGQVVLKHYKRGVVLLLVVSASLVVVFIKAIQRAFTILEKIESEGGVMNLSAISNAAIQGSTPSESLTFKLLFLLIIVCWIIGIVDAYIIGRKKDIEDTLMSGE